MNDIKTFIGGLHTPPAVAEDNTLQLQPDLKATITRELKFNDVYAKLVASKQDTVTFKEIIVESEIDFIKSVNQLKAVFDIELSAAIDKVDELYHRELLNLQSLYHKEFFGAPLLDLISKLSDSEYTLVMMNSRVYAYKYYDPPLEVTEGRFESGVVYDYDEPVCRLKGVYVNLLHPKVSNGTVLIKTDDRHPNAKEDGLSEACVGSLDERIIPIGNPDSLVVLLDEICMMYEVMHLDSAYFIPEASYTTRTEVLKWTA